MSESPQQEEKYQWFINQLDGASLHLVENGKSAKVFLLRRYPDRLVFSCWIVFCPFGIVIGGDISVTTHGVIANGYGVDWFAGKLDPEYLASKFLDKKWIQDDAISYWKDVLAEEKSEMAQFNAEMEEQRSIWKDTYGNLDEWEDALPTSNILRPKDWRVGSDFYSFKGTTVIQALEYLLEDSDNFSTPEVLFNSLPEYKDESSGCWICPWDCTDLMGYGYKEGEIGWLVAVQRKFAELYPTLEAIHE